MVRRVGALFEQIADPDNLRLAYLKARRGKMGKAEVKEYSVRLDENLEKLGKGLLGQAELSLGDYHYFMVFDPKPRMICAASFNERVLHHAVMNHCEPVFERFANFDSYACRKGKGGHKALLRTQFYCRKFPWYLKLDIRKYFDSIVHRVLQKKLERLFRERRLLSLFADILATYETRPGLGLPIGNLISQHLANFYLGFLDHWLKNELKVKGYVRYMDDFILFAESRSLLRECLEKIENFLDFELGLEIKKNIQLNRTVCGIPFLGYRVFAGKLRLKPAAKKRFMEKFRLYEKMYQSGCWSENELQSHIEALFAFVLKAQSEGLRKKVLVAV